MIYNTLFPIFYLDSKSVSCIDGVEIGGRCFGYD